MLRRFSLLLVASTCLIAPQALAADPPSTASAARTLPAVAVSTDEFLSKTAAGNRFEIDSSKLALSRSQSETVKAFASQMVTDHGQAAVAFKQAATEGKVKAPADALDIKHQAILDDLKKKEGPAFDKAYVDAQLQGHEETVGMFDAYAQSGDNPRLKQFASDLLPTLRSHLDRAKKLKTSLGTI